MHCGNGHETGECKMEVGPIRPLDPDDYPEYRRAREYKSPFKLPECNYTGKSHYVYDPLHNPTLHSENDNCPLHEAKPFSKWQKWARAREDYAQNPSTENYELMLSYVSDTNPPDAPNLVIMKPAKTKTWHDIDGRPHSYQEPVRRRPPDFVLVFASLAAVCWVLVMVIAIFVL
jgi:hypothetical protein